MVTRAGNFFFASKVLFPTFDSKIPGISCSWQPSWDMQIHKKAHGCHGIDPKSHSSTTNCKGVIHNICNSYDLSFNLIHAVSKI